MIFREKCRPWKLAAFVLSVTHLHHIQRKTSNRGEAFDVDGAVIMKLNIFAYNDKSSGMKVCQFFFIVSHVHSIQWKKGCKQV